MNNTYLFARNLIFCLLSIWLLALSGCACFTKSEEPAEVPSIGHGLLKGYLPQDDLPNSLALLPPPPGEETAAFAHDEEVATESIALRDTDRWQLAAADADLDFDHAIKPFSCASRIAITRESTPYLYMLLRRSVTDAGLSTYTAKNHYNRARPFMENHQPICTPEERAQLEKDGSYPSGHTAFGWAWALILAEVAPEQADEILARGRFFGESRFRCNVHWYSDVVSGRMMGAAVVAVLHSNPEFLSDLEKAKAEVKHVRRHNHKPTGDCEPDKKLYDQ